MVPEINSTPPLRALPIKLSCLAWCIYRTRPLNPRLPAVHGIGNGSTSYVGTNPAKTLCKYVHASALQCVHDLPASLPVFIYGDFSRLDATLFLLLHTLHQPYSLKYCFLELEHCAFKMGLFHHGSSNHTCPYHSLAESQLFPKTY